MEENVATYPHLPHAPGNLPQPRRVGSGGRAKSMVYAIETESEGGVAGDVY